MLGNAIHTFLGGGNQGVGPVLDKISLLGSIGVSGIFDFQDGGCAGFSCGGGGGKPGNLDTEFAAVFAYLGSTSVNQIRSAIPHIIGSEDGHSKEIISAGERTDGRFSGGGPGEAAGNGRIRGCPLDILGDHVVRSVLEGEGVFGNAVYAILRSRNQGIGASFKSEGLVARDRRLRHIGLLDGKGHRRQGKAVYAVNTSKTFNRDRNGLSVGRNGHSAAADGESRSQDRDIRADDAQTEYGIIGTGRIAVDLFGICRSLEGAVDTAEDGGVDDNLSGFAAEGILEGQCMLAGTGIGIVLIGISGAPTLQGKGDGLDGSGLHGVLEEFAVAHIGSAVKVGSRNAAESNGVHVLVSGDLDST